MASGVFLGLLAVLAAVQVWLQPCAALPVDTSQHTMQLVQKFGGEKGGKYDLCLLCEGVVEVVKIYLERNSSVEEIVPVVEPLCLFYMNKTKGYNGQFMCPGILSSYLPVVLYVLAEGTLNPSDICYLAHFCNRSSGSRPPPPPLPSLLEETWSKRHSNSPPPPRPSLATLQGKPLRHDPAAWSATARTKKKREGDPIVFLQLSDIHLDQLFAEGSPSICNLYLCCRTWYNGTGPAGRYGDFNCDLPLATLDVVVEAIANLDPQPDFIIYTGDNSPHDVWNETWAGQYQATEFLVSYLSQKLPQRHIYPALGNHETFPESEYMGTLPHYQELNKKMAEYWQKLVPLPQSAVETIADGCYYTTLVQDNLRIISFNSDYGYTINFYTHLNDKNAYFTRQQEWILDTLEKAEQAGEKVMMMAHIPPGDPGNTLAAYEEFYLNLTKRYRDTIVAHLFGHTHHDEFKLIQDREGVYGTLLICPSVTPYGRSNPSFRIFSMDPSSYQLLGYQQYHLNLSLANELASKGVKPKLELAYTTSDLYGLPDLTPPSWADLVERFSDYHDLVSEYRYNIYGQTSSGDRSCDQRCVRETICAVSNILGTARLSCLADSTH